MRTYLILFHSIVLGTTAIKTLASPPTRISAHHELAGEKMTRFKSPDGKYIVALFSGEAVTDDLQVFPTYPARNHNRAAAMVPNDGVVVFDGGIHDSAGFEWVPGQPHMLIFGISGLYGHAELAMWNGGHELIVLRRAKQPNDETFMLDAISTDGKIVYYEHGTDSLEHMTRHRLMLRPHN